MISSANLPAQISLVLKFLSKSADCFSSIISIVTHLVKYNQSNPVNHFLPDCNKIGSRLSAVTSYFYFLTKCKFSKAKLSFLTKGLPTQT